MRLADEDTQISIIKYSGQYFVEIEGVFDYFRNVRIFKHPNGAKLLDAMELPIRRVLTQEQIQEVFNG